MNQVTEQARNADRQGGETAGQTHLRPAGDIFEHGHGITIVLDMPGVSKDRLNIHSDRNTLRRDFSVSGEQLDVDAIEASLRDGVLRIDIPKRAELRPRKIEVRTG